MRFEEVCMSYRYRTALIWEDSTVDYTTEIVSNNDMHRPVCGRLYRNPYSAYFSDCIAARNFVTKHMCQIPHHPKQQYDYDDYGSGDTVHGHRPESVSRSTSQHTWPSLATVNSTALGQHRQQWNMVTCPKGHVTHVFLACDVSVSCFAEGDTIFSLHPETWALPSSQSCPVPLGVTSPPSFPCDSDEWRVPYSLLCDHRRDCLDGSDETFCKFTPCSWQSQFQCLNMQVCCCTVFPIGCIDHSSSSFACSRLHLYLILQSSDICRIE